MEWMDEGGGSFNGPVFASFLEPRVVPATEVPLFGGFRMS